MSIVEKAKEFFYQILAGHRSDPFNMKDHLPEVEKWSEICMQEIPADEEIVGLGVWLHDIGHSNDPAILDHAVNGETIATQFLTEQGYNPEKIKQVGHCVRAHRCKDVMPETVEAKIIAFSDSASHMTQTDMYLGYAKELGIERTLLKIERDYEDLGIFPKMQERLTPLYLSWKQLLKAYQGIIGDLLKK